MVDYSTYIGYVGGLFASCLNVPLVINSCQRPPSFPPTSFLVLYTCMSSCFIIYSFGLSENGLPVLIPNIIGQLLILIVIVRQIWVTKIQP